MTEERRRQINQSEHMCTLNQKVIQAIVVKGDMAFK